MSTYTTGQKHEEAAARYLSSCGYRILERDYHFGHKDIDIIALDPEGTLVFAEVKFRKGSSMTSPFQAVTPSKQKNISQAAVMYLVSHGFSFDSPCRFDVISVSGEKLTHLKNAFELCADSLGR